MERKRKGGKPRKMASLPFFRPGFLTKTRKTVCKHLTRPPWRYSFLKNGKVCFWDAFVQQEKVPQKKEKKWMGLKFDRLFD